VEVLALVSVKGPIAYIGHSKFLLYLFHGLLHILLPLLSGGKRGACDALRNRGLNQRQRKSFLSLLFSGEQFYPKWYRLLLSLFACVVPVPMPIVKKKIKTQIRQLI
jgi:hypothetical protein